jgi:hypothetical protein
MTPEEAIDAAVLAFLDGAETRNAREGVALAVAAYEDALLKCRACRGSGQLRTHGQLVHLRDDRFRAAQDPVPDGEPIPCVACAGQGVDLDQAAWLCVAHGYNQCSRDRRVAEHSECGWVLRRRQQNPPGQSR